MTGADELGWLQYGEEHNIGMLSIATSNEKIMPDAKLKPLLLMSLF